jgi:hypothetical protein
VQNYIAIPNLVNVLPLPAKQEQMSNRSFTMIADALLTGIPAQSLTSF